MSISEWSKGMVYQNLRRHSKYITVLVLAWRNIIAKRRRTLIIGMFVLLVTIVLILAHSFAYTIHNNIQVGFTDYFTSDMILRHHSSEDTQAEFIDRKAIVPLLPHYPDIKQYLQQHPNIKQFTPVLHASAEVVIAENISSRTFLWGIEPTSYVETFPHSLSLQEGSLWQEGERGIVLSQGFKEAAKILYKIDLHVGDMLTLTNSNHNTGLKITQIPIRGFAIFSSVLDRFGNNVVFVDAHTVRYLTGATLYQVTYDEVESNQDNSSITDDSLFDQDFIIPADAFDTSSTIDYDTILGDASRRDKYAALDNNGWHFVLIDSGDFAHKEELRKSIQQHMNQYSDSTGKTRLENWSWGARLHLDIVRTFQNVLNVALVIILIAVILVMINILVISINERITEIGVMRALGAQKTFVLSLIAGELFLIILIFSVIGMFLSTLILLLIQQQGIVASNFIATIIFAGDVFYPTIAPLSFGIAFTIVLASGMLAIIYSINLALRISPKVAMDRNS